MKLKMIIGALLFVLSVDLAARDLAKITNSHELSNLVYDKLSANEQEQLLSLAVSSNLPKQVSGARSAMSKHFKNKNISLNWNQITNIYNNQGLNGVKRHLGIIASVPAEVSEPTPSPSPIIAPAPIKFIPKGPSELVKGDTKTQEQITNLQRKVSANANKALEVNRDLKWFEDLRQDLLQNKEEVATLSSAQGKKDLIDVIDINLQIVEDRIKIKEGEQKHDQEQQQERIKKFEQEIKKLKDEIQTAWDDWKGLEKLVGPVSDLSQSVQDQIKDDSNQKESLIKDLEDMSSAITGQVLELHQQQKEKVLEAKKRIEQHVHEFDVEREKVKKQLGNQTKTDWQELDVKLNEISRHITQSSVLSEQDKKDLLTSLVNPRGEEVEQKLKEFDLAFEKAKKEAERTE